MQWHKDGVFLLPVVVDVGNNNDQSAEEKGAYF
jgi:hypothetical protein